MPTPQLTASFPTTDDFLTAFDNEVKVGGLLVKGASLPGAVAMSECTVEVRVPGHPPVSEPARVAAVMDGVGVAVMFTGPPEALARLADKVRNKGGDDDEEMHGTVLERVRAMNTSEKIQLALHGNRDERMALLRDTNKVLHMYVLKNPHLGQDEVLWAAKSTNTSPDALKFMAEHPEWGNNANVCGALVRNPHTPTPLAVRLMDKLPHAELRAIAKTASARQAIVQAARRKINE